MLLLLFYLLLLLTDIFRSPARGGSRRLAARPQPRRLRLADAESAESPAAALRIAPR